MPWNHRILRHTCNRGNEEIEWFAIHEVYYDDEGKPDMCTLDPAYPYGETTEELEKDMEYFSQAFKAPVLDFADF